VRGYLSGSGWKEYQKGGTVCGIPLPAGLLDGSRLPEALYTPSTKGEAGTHDENISYAATVAAVGEADAAALKHLTLAIYKAAAKHAESRGLILADTKFEFGMVDGELILADEVPGALTGATQLQENEMGLSEWEAELLGELRLLHTEDRQRVLNAVKAFVAGLPKREPMKYPTPASSVPESPSGRLLKKLTSGLYKRGGNPSP